MAILTPIVWPDFGVRLLDENGDAYGLKHVGNKLRVSSMSYLQEIAEGNIANHHILNVLGYNDSVGNTEEDLWEVGGSYVFPSAGMQMEVRSTSASDTNASGTGMRTVTIHYLDDAWAEQEETVVLAGLTPVTTNAEDIYRIQEMHAATVGSGGAAAGSIDIRHLADTPIYGRITAGNNDCLDGFWTVPANKTAYITSWGVGVAGGNKDARFILRATCNWEGELSAGIFQNKGIIILEDASTREPFTVSAKIPAKADIKMSVVSAAQTAHASGYFEGWYKNT